MRTALIVTIGHLIACGAALAQAPPEVVARQAQQVLAKHCTKCHGQVNPQSGLSVLDYQYLTSKGFITPKKLDESSLWERVSSTDESVVMPPTGALSAEEQGYIKQWIELGAPLWSAAEPPPRPRMSTAQIFLAVEKDVRGYPPEDRQYLRYFSFTHLYNNPAVGEKDLRVFRAALAKVCNSLSWESALYRPEPIDEYKTVYRINLVKLGWFKPGLWKKLVSHYPYGLVYDSMPDPAWRSAAEYVYGELGTPLPVVRADWFIANATQPPIYEEMLMLHTGEGADHFIEQKLNVNVIEDYLTNREIRAGAQKSNVSEHNRLVARHPAAFGAYWKSYDFALSNEKQNLLINPLGPPHAKNEFNRYAFQHDGGELIWNLPNGLQAYLLVDAKGKYIPKGPINIVFDSKQPLRNKEVINGISCMACHVYGMQPYVDDVLAGHALQGAAEIKVQRLYPPQEELDKYIAEDRQRYMRAYEACCADYLRVDDDKDLPLEKFAEPVVEIAKEYIDEMTMMDVVCELGYENVEALKVIFDQQQFRKYGLGVLPVGKVIKRESWDFIPPGSRYSVFQDVASALKLGTPIYIKQ